MQIDVLQLIHLYEGNPSLDVGIMTMNGQADKFSFANNACVVINNSAEEKYRQCSLMHLQLRCALI